MCLCMFVAIIAAIGNNVYVCNNVAIIATMQKTTHKCICIPEKWCNMTGNLYWRNWLQTTSVKKDLGGYQMKKGI